MFAHLRKCVIILFVMPAPLPSVEIKASVFLHPELHHKLKMKVAELQVTLSEYVAGLVARELKWTKPGAKA